METGFVGKLTKLDLTTIHCTDAQNRLFDLSYTAALAVDKAMRTAIKPVVQWLVGHYGRTPPTYEQFWSDREALRLVAKARGLTDDQAVRRPYNAAVKQAYGALPVSPSEPATKKREYREAVKAAEVQTPTKKVETMRRVKPAEVEVRRLLAKYGLADVMLAFSVIMAEHRETAQESVRVANLGKKYHDLHPENGQVAMH